MKRIRLGLSALVGMAVAAAAAPAWAHVIDGADGALAGLAHPLGGLDHLLAALAAGMLARCVGRRLGWPLAAAALAAFGLIHVYTHGAGTSGAAGALYWAGLVGATAALAAAGYALDALVERSGAARGYRASSAALALFGLILLAGV